MSDNGFRRVFPPPRRRPGLGTVLIRWWREAVLLGVPAAIGALAGWRVLLGVLVLGAGALAFEPVRHFALGCLRALVALHRLRVGFIEAGTTTRDGRLPLLVGVRFTGDQVRVATWCRAGTTPADLAATTEVLATACGAARVLVVADDPRSDQVVLVVVRPRWGEPGK